MVELGSHRAATGVLFTRFSDVIKGGYFKSREDAFCKLLAPPKTATSFISPQFSIYITQYIYSPFSEFGMLCKYCKETLIMSQVFVVCHWGLDDKISLFQIIRPYTKCSRLSICLSLTTNSHLAELNRVSIRHFSGRIILL